MNPIIGGLQGEEWKFIQKYLKKNIQKCRPQLSGSFRRISQAHKMAVKFRRQTRWLRNHFAAKGWFRSPAKLAFNLEWSSSNGSNFFISTLILQTVWRIGLLTFWSSKWHIACINWTSGSAPKVVEMTVIKNASWQIFSLLPLLAFRIAYGKGL